MVRNFLLLFLALRAADLLNLFGGIWLVPKYVSPEDLGAVLPLTTFATLVAIPLYALAMTALRESARLRAAGRSPRSLVRGVFAATGVAAVLALALAAALLPRAAVRFRLTDSLSGHLAVAAAFLGCVSPVYLDQLQAAKRFVAVGAVEVSAALVRLGVMAALMPFRALAGYFAGSVVKPLVQIAGPLLALSAAGRTSRRGLAGKASDDAYWTSANRARFAKTFAGMLVYIGVPMLASLTESELVRTLPDADSAGYYLATRISDLMNYLTYPILFVMFPYVTDCAERGESGGGMVAKACGVIFAVAIAGAAVTAFFGSGILALLPNGGNYGAYAELLPMLFAFMAFGAAQTAITNAEAAAGRFSFLRWLVPVNLVYVVSLPLVLKSSSLDALVLGFTLFAMLRFLFALTVRIF